MNVFGDHFALAFFDKECRTGLNVGGQGAGAAEAEYTVPDFVGGTGGDDARLAIALGDHVHCLDGDITHEQEDLHVGEEGDFFFQQVGTVFDGRRGDAVPGLAALDCRGQVDTQVGDVLDGINLCPGILEGEQGGAGEESLGSGIIMIVTCSPGWLRR